MNPAALLLALPALFQDPFAAPPSGSEFLAPPEPGSQTVHVLLATCNDQVLTSTQVNVMALSMARRAQQAGDTIGQEEFTRFQQQAYQSLLLDMLFREGFRAEGLPEDMLDRIVADEVERAIEDAGSVAAFNARLGATGSDLEAEARGLRRFYTSLLFLRVEQGYMPAGGAKGVKNRLYTRPEAIVAYYRDNPGEFRREFRVQARMILLRDEAGAPPAEDRIRDLTAQVRSGAVGFAEAAREHSAYRASIGGSLGWVQPEQSNLQKPILDFLSTAARGELSEPIRVSNGWVVVLAEEVRQAGMVPFEEVQLQIAGKLMENRRMDIMKEAVNRLRKRCYLWGPDVEAALDGAFQPTPTAPEDF